MLQKSEGNFGILGLEKLFCNFVNFHPTNKKKQWVRRNYVGFSIVALWDWDFRASKGRKNERGELWLKASPTAIREETISRPERGGLYIEKKKMIILPSVIGHAERMSLSVQKNNVVFKKCTLHAIIKDEGYIAHFELDRTICKTHYRLGVKCSKP